MPHADGMLKARCRPTYHPSGFLGARQVHHDREPAPEAAIDHHGAAVVSHNRVTDEHAETAGIWSLLPREERIHDAAEVRRVHAGMQPGATQAAARARRARA